MNTKTERFAVFILTHGRAHNVITLRTLERQGYTGEVYLIVDNEDDELTEYQRLYGDRVIVFDKLAASKYTDSGDNFAGRGTVLYARNACFDIARNLGITYFLELDDDYTEIRHKYSSEFVYRGVLLVKSLDRLFATVLRYYTSIPASTIALAQGGDFMGGPESGYATRLWLHRKAMNTFFCSVDRPFRFLGRMNDDVNTYISLGNRGCLFLTYFSNAIQQHETQQEAGGLTEMYLERGTYQKSFYTVMYAPSCVKVGQTSNIHRRIHHRIKWADAVPCILSEQYRKRLAA